MCVNTLHRQLGDEYQIQHFDCYSIVQRQTAVAAYLSGDQLLSTGSASHYWSLYVQFDSPGGSPGLTGMTFQMQCLYKIDNLLRI